MEIQALQMTPVTMRATSHLGETVDRAETKSFGTYQKAEIALQLTLQLRNRAVSAYQEIMRMQV